MQKIFTKLWAQHQAWFLLACLLIGIFSTFLIWKNFAQAATGNINGIVTDSVSGLPLAGVAIVLVSTGQSTTSGEDGSYTLADVNSGFNSVRFSLANYSTYTGNITVVKYQTVTLNAALTPISYGSAEGTITDSGTGLPIEGASVVITGGDISATFVTDAMGFYSTSSIQSGTYSVLVSKSGYVASSSNELTVTESNTTILDISLSPNPPLTVCDSGCGYTKISSAITNATSSDTIIVRLPYSGNALTFPFNPINNTYTPLSLTANITLECEEGVEIGAPGDTQVTILAFSSTTIQNCHFSNVNIQHTNDACTNIQILNNTFATSTRSEINFGFAGFNNTLISGNTGLSYIYISQGDNSIIQNNILNIYTTSTYSGIRTGSNEDVIQGNEINIYNTSTFAGILLNSPDNSIPDSITVSNNIIRNYVDNSINLIDSVEAKPRNTTITSNTLEYIVAPTAGNISAIKLIDGLNNTISYNKIKLPAGTGDQCFGIKLISNTQDSQYTITHNTVKMEADCVGIGARWDNLGTTSFITDIQYNIFANTSETAQGTGLEYYSESNEIATITHTNDYNGFYNLTTNLSNIDTNPTVTQGIHSFIGNPVFRAADSYELATFSNYLDFNGENDIGARENTRNDVINIDDSGTINWESVHATNTSFLSSAGVLRDGQIINLAAGNYDGFTLTTNSLFTGNVTITGAGADTIVQAASNNNGIILNGLQNTVIQNLTLTNAASSQDTYLTNPHGYHYNDVNYNTIYAGGSDAITGMYLITNNVGVDGIVLITTSTDISANVGDTPQDWHLALAQCTISGHAFSAPVYFRSDVFTNQTIAETFWASFGCGPFDYWATSTLTFDGTNYIFNDPENNNEPTALAGSPTIAHRNSYAGIKVIDSTDVLISNITSTANGYGIWFTGNSNNNIVSSSAFVDNTGYDLVSDSAGTNIFKDVFYNAASSTASNLGQVWIYYKLRGLVKNISAEPIAGVAVNIIPNDASLVLEKISGTDGYTDYTDYLLTLITDSTHPTGLSTSLNPFSLIALASSTYSETTVTSTLNSPAQTITLEMANAPVLPAPDETPTTSPSFTGSGTNWIGPTTPTILYPTTGQIITALPFKILGNASFGNIIYVKIGGTTYALNPDDNGRFEVSILDLLTPGTYTISIYQEDPIGRKSFTIERQITYQTITPTVIKPEDDRNQTTKKITLSTNANQITIKKDTADITAGETIIPINNFNSIPPSPTAKEITEISKNLTSQDGAFILFRRNSTAGFYRDQINAIELIPGEKIEVLIRPDQPAHNIVARLYELNTPATALKSTPKNWMEKFKSWFGDTAKAEQLQLKEKLVGAYLFEHLPEMSAFRGNIISPTQNNKSYRLLVTIIGENSTRINIAKDINTINPGYIFHNSKNTTDNRITNAQIAVYQQAQDGNFTLWNANEYGQTNPFFTNKDGGYSLSVPAGTYYLKISAPQHKDFISKTLTYQTPTIIKDDIELEQRRVNMWEKLWDWIKQKLS